MLRNLILILMMISSVFANIVHAEVEDVNGVNLHLEENELAVSFLPLPSGEATLLQNGFGESVLINTGSTHSLTELKHWLKVFGIDSLTAVVVTRDEEEYAGNLSSLLSSISIGEVFVSENVKLTDDNKTTTSQSKISILHQGEKRPVIQGLNLEVIFSGENEGEGLDLAFTYNQHTFWFLASTSEQSDSVMQQHLPTDISLIKLADFGSFHSISDQLLKKLDPQMAVIFQRAGTEPSEDLLEELQESWIDSYYTKIHGLLSIKFTPETYEIEKIDRTKSS